MTHIELTGVDNKLILENARRIVQRGKAVRIRLPLILGCNDSPDNIRALGEFIVSLGLTEADILPYHRLGNKKYEMLGKEYQLGETESYHEEQVQEIKRRLEQFGIVVSVA